MKRKNWSIVFDIISIVFFIILFINDLFICTDVFSMSFFDGILKGNITLFEIVFLSVLVFLVLLILGNLFIIIIKDKSLKTILLRVFCIVLLIWTIYKTIWIFHYGYMQDFHDSYSFLLISVPKIVLIVLSIIGIYSEKNSFNESKFFGVYSVIIIISFIAFSIVYLLFFITFKNNNDKMADFIYRLNRNVLNTEFLIPVKKNNKWGCINRKGKLVVDYKYDDMCSIANSLYISKYVLAQENNDYIYIDNDGEVVERFHNDFLPIKSDAYISSSWSDNFDYRAMVASSFIATYAPNACITVKDEEKNVFNLKYEYNDNFEKVYDVDFNDGYKLELIESSVKNDDYGDWFDITYKLNDEVLFSVKNAKISLTLVRNDLKYNDYNDIAFTNQKDSYGYINIMNHEYNLLKGNVDYIDTTSDMYYYLDSDEDTVFFKEKQSNMLLGVYYRINGGFNKGFIVKSKDGKYSFLDLDLHEFFLESDDISEIYLFDDLYVCTKDKVSFVFNSKGERISNVDYQEVKSVRNK